MIYLKLENDKYYIKKKFKEKVIKVLTFNLVKYNSTVKPLTQEQLYEIESMKQNENCFDIINLFPSSKNLKDIYLTGVRLGKHGISKYVIIIEIDKFKFDNDDHDDDDNNVRTFSFYSNKNKIIVNWLYPDKFYQFKRSCDLIYLLELFNENFLKWRNEKVCNLIKQLPLENPLKLLTNQIFIRGLKLIGFKPKEKLINSILLYYNLLNGKLIIQKNIYWLKLFFKFEKHFNDNNENFKFYNFPNHLCYNKDICVDGITEKKFKFLRRVVNLNSKRLYFTNNEFDGLNEKWLNHPLFKIFNNDNYNSYICMAIEVFMKVLILINKNTNKLIKVDTLDNSYEKINGIEYLDLIKLCY